MLIELYVGKNDFYTVIFMNYNHLYIGSKLKNLYHFYKK